MKVIIASTIVPFVGGGSRVISDSLHAALVARGHEVEQIDLPFHPDPRLMPQQMIGLRSIDLSGASDRLIAIRTPSYLIRHHSKVTWFIHHHRPAYDLWQTHRDVSDDGCGWEFRRMMFASDELALAECRHVYTNSAVMSDRLRRYNGIDSTVLYPPLPIGHGIVHGPPGDYAVIISRLYSHKRQELAIEALARTQSRLRLVLAGKGESPRTGDRLREQATRLGVADRVEVMDTWISEDTKRELLANCLVALSLPVDEDSYSYAALEAAYAGKPIVTASDTGGVLELVKDRVNGLVCDPTPEAIADALDEISNNPELAQQLGANNDKLLQHLGLDWDHVVTRLLD